MTTGAVTTYNQASTLQKRSVRDLIDMIEFTDAPMLKWLGLNNESRFRLLDWPRIKYEWFKDTMAPRTGTLDESGFDDTETDLTVATGQGDYLKAGDVILMESELILVTSVSGVVATVVRGWAGSTAAAHVTTTPWEIVGVARNENSDYALAYTTTPTAEYNYTQIFDHAVSVSNSEAKDSKYGIDDTLAYHFTKALSDGKRAGHLPILMEKSFYYGKRYAGTASIPRSYGGFNYFISSHTTAKASAGLDLIDIENLVADIFDDGGRPDTIVVNSWGKRKISEFFKGSIRTERSDRAGGAVIDTIVTDFGNLEVVHDWLCPSDHLYILSKDTLGWVEFRPFEIMDLPVTTDGVIKRVVGEYGFVMLNEQANGKITGFSTSV